MSLRVTLVKEVSYRRFYAFAGYWHGSGGMQYFFRSVRCVRDSVCLSVCRVVSMQRGEGFRVDGLPSSLFNYIVGHKNRSLRLCC